MQLHGERKACHRRLEVVNRGELIVRPAMGPKSVVRRDGAITDKQACVPVEWQSLDPIGTQRVGPGESVLGSVFRPFVLS